MKWISVKEKFPPTIQEDVIDPLLLLSEKVLIHSTMEEVHIGYLVYSPKDWFEEGDLEEYNWYVYQLWDDHQMCDVTHWMPLPKPPENK